MFQIKDVNLAVAKKLNIDIKVVERINNIYYKQVIKDINSYKDSEIKLTYLGTFKARYAPVKKRIRSLIYFIRELKKDKQTDAVKDRTKAFIIELRNLWKIKNEFAIKSYKSKHKCKNTV